MSQFDDVLQRVNRARRKLATARPVRPPQPDDQDFMPVGLNGLMAASEKLLAVNRGVAPLDHRDGLAYKRVVEPTTLLREAIRMDSSKMGRKMLRIAASRRNLSGFMPFIFDDYGTKMLIGGNPLSSSLEETNPMHIVENARRMTAMGPGGIGSRDALTADMQAVNADQFGFLDVVAGPESEMAGIDTRLAWGTRIGSDGLLYQQFRNKRTGEIEWLSPVDLLGKTLKLND